MLLTDHEPGLARRVQLTRGLHWLYAAQGDPYAALLRGYDLDPAAVDALREPGALWRSRTGDWVAAGYAAAAAALACPDLEPTLLDLARQVSACAAPEDLAVHEACSKVLDRLPARFDIVATARAVAVSALGGDPNALMWTDAAGAVDAVLCPPSPAAAATLRAALARIGDGFASAAVPVATALAADAVLAHLDRRPVRLTDVLRAEPPVHLVPCTATADVRIAETTVEKGQTLVVAVGAANRDPGARSVLVPGGSLAPVVDFARAVAGALLTALAERHPGLRADGPALRARRAPVTRTLSRCPVAAA
ncbi:hypothetical protein [Actinokineospora sp.]|uniref:hypothetical protein n=1 Tax=Actinokineospora sp. TaxID=1872133 RepID=UPI0040379217